MMDSSSKAQKSLAFLVVPAVALLIGILLWAVTLSRANSDLTKTENTVLKEASSYVEAYEQYITRSVGQMDQVTMQLKQSWEQSRGALRLEEMAMAGMFTDSAFIAVSIIDSHGVLRSSAKPMVDMVLPGGTDYFTFHKNNNSSALRIGVPSGNHDPSQGVVQFTRRLDTDDDEFAGVVVLTVDANYFTSFYSASILGQQGLLALLGEDSALRLEKHGAGISLLANASLLTSRQAFNTPFGANLLRGKETFIDGEDRIVAWKKSSAYPLYVLVARSHREAMASSHTYWKASRNNSILATICLLLLAVLGATMARRLAARQHEKAEVRRAYRTATEGANEGFYMAHPVRNSAGRILDFEIIDCNEHGASLYGRSRSELIGARMSMIDSSVFGSALTETYCAAMGSGFHEDERRMSNQPDITWGNRRLVRVGNGLAITLQDISERKAHESELLRLANEDALTGLPNRYWLINFMPKTLLRAQNDAAVVALLFIDLDEFKHVNDTLGHAVGDKLLQAAALRLQSLLRPTDHVVRFGGDEFIVVLNPADSDQQVVGVAERILAALALPFAIADETLSVGASIGISAFPRDGDDAATLIKHADIAMYSGKSEGKGQYRFFNPSLYKTLKTRTQFKHSLIEAIEKDQLILYYQPRVNTQTGELVSMEALIRWMHPTLGLIPPLEFIPLAESSGLILRIGEMVMDKACAQLLAWRTQDLALVPISINVSPKQFSQGHIHRQLAAQLTRYNIPPNLLEVEITESAMMGEQAEIIAELTAIRDLGIKLHVDDFGTGYSSLSQLQKLKMDALKVDKAFTSELGNSKEGKVFFQAIVSMAHALGMSVVAEGVETLEQLHMLQALGCNEVQGYFIARPIPPQDMVPLLQKRFLFPKFAPVLQAT